MLHGTLIVPSGGIPRRPKTTGPLVGKSNKRTPWGSTALTSGTLLFFSVDGDSRKAFWAAQYGRYYLCVVEETPLAMDYKILLNTWNMCGPLGKA